MCIFCKIAANEMKSFKIYEDTETLALLDISNDFIGHTLVMPKKHCENIFDCPEEILAAVMKTVKKVSKYYTESCDFSGVNVFCNNGSAAGQTVMHLHFHIVPQKDGEQQNVFSAPEGKKRDLKYEQLMFKLI